MDDIKLLIDLAGSLVAPIAGILLSVFSWKKTGEIDLRKTLEHAADVFHIVQKLMVDGTDEKAALDRGVEEIEAIRGHKVSKKLRRKARARLKALLGK